MEFEKLSKQLLIEINEIELSELNILKRANQSIILGVDKSSNK